jgi:glycosyltransferase involved in cell wall biosynthesis
VKSYLLITPLDVAKQANNREHHLLRHLAPRFASATVVYRRRCDPGGLAATLRDALVPSTRVQRGEDGVTYVEVNPLFNHVQGLAMDLAGVHEAPVTEATGLRHRVRRAVSGLGIFKDLSTIALLALAAALHARGRIDVCQASGPHGNAAAWLLRRMGKVSLWVYEDRDYEPGFFDTPLRNRFTAWLERVLIARADACISIGERLARLRRRQARRVVAVVPTGVDAARFVAAPDPRAAAPVIVYAGNVTWWSGLDLAVEALPAIARRVPAVRLLVAGEGLPGYVASLRARARSLGVEDRITLLGRVPSEQIPPILAQGALGWAVFAPLELRRYAAPLKVCEYMAAGLPTLGTRDSETEELLTRWSCGVVVAYDSEAVAHEAVALLLDGERRASLAANARSGACAHEWTLLMEREYTLIEAAWEARVPARGPAAGGPPSPLRRLRTAARIGIEAAQRCIDPWIVPPANARLAARAHRDSGSFAEAIDRAIERGIAWFEGVAEWEPDSLFAFLRIVDASHHPRLAMAQAALARRRAGWNDPFLRCYDPGYDWRDADPGKRTWMPLAPMHDLMHRAVMADRYALDARFLDELRALDDGGGYGTTHVLLGCALLRLFGSFRGDVLDREIERCVEPLVAAQAAARVGDLFSERTAFLLWQGYTDRVSPAWIARIVRGQLPDGGWYWRRPPLAASSAQHPTCLAVAALLLYREHVLRGRREAPPFPGMAPRRS